MMKRCAMMMWLAGWLAGCGADADFTGDYDVALVNGDNGCEFEDWIVGETTTDVPVVLTQSGGEVTAEVGGLAGVFLGLALGSNIYTGETSGDEIELTLFGETAFADGNCGFTFNSVIEATLDGDFLEGTVSYEAATNGNPDCAAIEGCASVQVFNGSRPPSVDAE